MKQSTVARRLAFWKPATGIGVAAVASLVLAAGANATVVTPAPDLTGSTDNVQTAIASLVSGTACSSTVACPGPNTLILQPGAYNSLTPISIPASIAPLTITTNHAAQAALGTGTPSTNWLGGPAASSSPNTPWMTLATGATVTMEGVTLSGMGGTGAPAFKLPSGSTLNLYNTAILGPGQDGVDMAGATLNMSDSMLYQPVATGLNASASSTVNVTNSDIINSQTGDNVSASSSTVSISNSVLAEPGNVNCAIPSTSTIDHVLTDDTSCPNAAGNSLANNSTMIALETTPPSESPYNGQTVFPVVANGGPALSVELPSASTGTDAMGGLLFAGNTAKCPVTDARFFVGTAAGCNVGEVTNADTMETTSQGPQCTIETISNTNPKFEIVDSAPGASGFGPSSGNGNYLQGPSTNPLTNIGTTVGFNTTSDINPADPITNESVVNGSVSILNPLSSPGIPTFISPVTGKPSLQVEAVKSNQGLATMWGFSTTDWAGQSVACI
jgi:hypothetical protein